MSTLIARRYDTLRPVVVEMADGRIRAITPVMAQVAQLAIRMGRRRKPACPW
jgi:hypothetical protein